MPDKSTTHANLYLVVDTDNNLIPTRVKPNFIPIAAGTNITITNDVAGNLVINSTGGSGGGEVISVDGVLVPPVGGVINFQDSTALQNKILFANTANNNIQASLDATAAVQVAELRLANPGNNYVSLDIPTALATNYTLFWPLAQGAAGQVLTNDGMGNLYWSTPSGGGGGGTFSNVIAKWTTANAATKNAYTSPGVINNDGISITLIATSNPGTLGNATILLASQSLSTSYAVTGTFPNYSVVVPVADITNNAAQTAADVSVNVVIGTSFNVAANNLSNRQPVAFAATLEASYALTSVPFYTTSTTVNYQYTTTGTATTLAGTINGAVVNTASGSLGNVAITGITLGGSVMGTGQFGAGSSTVSITGSSAGLPTFIPAFYAGAQTGATPPTFNTSSLQTPGSQVGATIVFTLATAASQYLWIATTRAANQVQQLTAFGPGAITPDVTATQTIAGTTFNVFGYTNLSTVTAAQFIIS